MTESAPRTMTATAYTVDNGVAWITLQRPEAANSRNQQMRVELNALYDDATNDPDVRVVVLTGEGDRFFCAGMDTKEASGEEAFLQRRERMRSSRDIDKLGSLPKPTIAAVNGYALGGGFEMALACDLRVLADHALLGLPEVSHGLVPAGGASARLPQIIGKSRTFELMYTGRMVSAAEAVHWGLANAAVPMDDLRDHVASLAKHIAEQPPLATRYAKELVQHAGELPFAAATSLELDALLALLTARGGER